MKEFNLKTGQIGEEIAKKYLEGKGYKIVEQNYRTKFAEIDIIAYNDNTLVFVEVRTKKSERFGTPEETLNKKKMLKLKRNALAYVSRIGWRQAYRLDAVCIVLKPDNALERLEHHQNI